MPTITIDINDKTYAWLQEKSSDIERFAGQFLDIAACRQARNERALRALRCDECEITEYTGKIWRASHER